MYSYKNVYNFLLFFPGKISQYGFDTGLWRKNPPRTHGASRSWHGNNRSKNKGVQAENSSIRKVFWWPKVASFGNPIIWDLFSLRIQIPGEKDDQVIYEKMKALVVKALETGVPVLAALPPMAADRHHIASPAAPESVIPSPIMAESELTNSVLDTNVANHETINHVCFYERLFEYSFATKAIEKLFFQD